MLPNHLLCPQEFLMVRSPPLQTSVYVVIIFVHVALSFSLYCISLLVSLGLCTCIWSHLFIISFTPCHVHGVCVCCGRMCPRVHHAYLVFVLYSLVVRNNNGLPPPPPPPPPLEAIFRILIRSPDKRIGGQFGPYLMDFSATLPNPPCMSIHIFYSCFSELETPPQSAKLTTCIIYHLPLLFLLVAHFIFVFIKVACIILYFFFSLLMFHISPVYVYVGGV